MGAKFEIQWLHVTPGKWGWRCNTCGTVVADRATAEGAKRPIEPEFCPLCTRVEQAPHSDAILREWIKGVVKRAIEKHAEDEFAHERR